MTEITIISQKAKYPSADAAPAEAGQNAARPLGTGTTDSLPREVMRLVKADPSYYEQSTLRTLVHIGALFGVLALAISLIGHGSLAAGTSFILIGIVQYSFAVSGHEASHFTLLSPRWLNELIGDLLTLTVFLELKNYRRFHLTHHRIYGEPADPDYALYQVTQGSALGFWLNMALHASGLFALKRFRDKTLGRRSLPGVGGTTQAKISYTVAVLVKVGVVQSVVFIVFLAFGAWWHYAVFWLLPLITLATALNRVRAFAEHAGLGVKGDLKRNRHLTARTHATLVRSPMELIRFLENKLFAPFNFGYHHEHHLLPSLPYQQLPRLHLALSALGYYDDHQDNLSESFIKTVHDAFR